MKRVLKKSFLRQVTLIAVLAMFALPSLGLARDVKYDGGEIDIHVEPKVPTQVTFPGVIAGGFKNKLSAVRLDRQQNDLIIFSTEGISEEGETLIVRLKDGRSYFVRVRRAGEGESRDVQVTVEDERSGIIASSEEEAPYQDRQFPKAPASKVSGLMREMVLVSEFGKENVPGYRVSETYAGEVVLDDGTLRTTIDRIFMGANLWGYVLNAENMLDQSQRLNPASFRLHGTRAISAERWELSPRPMTVEQQVAGKERAKIYVITRAK